MKLGAGKFYVSRDGFVWCCFRVNPSKEQHAYADCIRVADQRIEYFYEDGRYEGKGESENTLIKRLMVNPDVKTPDYDTAKG